MKNNTNKRKIKTSHLLILVLILVVGLFMRIYRLDTLPDGFFCDEASLGYNAWSILHYGIDETGAKMPLYATSLGVHKNPVFVYSSMIPIGILGLSEFSVRLTSAVYGTLTIAAVFWLVLEMNSVLAGLIAALLLAILPWNFHFSRVAFELITWPCLFTTGLAAMLRGCRKGGWIWLLAGALMGLAVHSYVMAMTFLPIFLPLFFLIYLKQIRKNYRWVLIGLLVFALFLVPAIMHHLDTRDTLHFRSVNWWAQSIDKPLESRLHELWNHYHPFFSKDFLVDTGDSNPRHTLANHGPIYESLFYLCIGGMILGLLPPKRYYWILLVWTALFPLGAALTIDRYATRSIIGSPLAPIWAALVLVCLCNWTARIKWRWLKYPIYLIIFLPVAGITGREAFAYFKRYHNEYNFQSACGIYGFQYGYKELIEFSEPLRKEYDQFIWTAHNVNEPYIFPLFYNKIDTRQYVKDYDIGYQITRAFEFNKYTIEPRTLFAVRTDELIFFDDYEVMYVLIGFDNTPQFTIIEPKSRRSYIDHWSVRGLRRNMQPENCSDEYPDPEADFLQPIDSLVGPAYWTAVNFKPPLVDIQGMFVNADPENPMNPEFVDAIGANWMYFDEAVNGTFEIFGSHDTMVLWLNGEIIMPPRQLSILEVFSNKFHMVQGWNECVFRGCEGVGDWHFVMTLLDENGYAIQPDKIRVAPPGIDDHPLPSDPILLETYGGVP